MTYKVTGLSLNCITYVNTTTVFQYFSTNNKCQQLNGSNYKRTYNIF